MSYEGQTGEPYDTSFFTRSGRQENGETMTRLSVNSYQGSWSLDNSYPRSKSLGSMTLLRGRGGRSVWSRIFRHIRKEHPCPDCSQYLKFLVHTSTSTRRLNKINLYFNEYVWFSTFVRSPSTPSYPHSSIEHGTLDRKDLVPGLCQRKCIK